MNIFLSSVENRTEGIQGVKKKMLPEAIKPLHKLSLYLEAPDFNI